MLIGGGFFSCAVNFKFFLGEITADKIGESSFVLALLIVNCIRRILNLVGWGGELLRVFRFSSIIKNDGCAQGKRHGLIQSYTATRVHH